MAEDRQKRIARQYRYRARCKELGKKRHSAYHKHKPGYYKQWYQKRIQQGLCADCNNPAVITHRIRDGKAPAYCKKHKEKRRIRAYNKRGIFGITDEQAKVSEKARIIARMKEELGNKFCEVKDFIESNLDLFKEEYDNLKPLPLFQEIYESSAIDVDSVLSQDRMDNL